MRCYPLVDPTFTPDGASGILYDVISGEDAGPDALNQTPASVSYLDVFPYLDHPVSGYAVQPLANSAAS